MTSDRTKTGMKRKFRKGDVVNIDTFIKIKGMGTKILNSCRAKIHSNRSATCIKDGRPLRKIGGKWVYIVK